MKLNSIPLSQILSMQATAQILDALQEPATSQELAQKFGCSLPSIQRKLRHLEAGGHVQRVGKRGHSILWRRA